MGNEDRTKKEKIKQRKKDKGGKNKKKYSKFVKKNTNF